MVDPFYDPRQEEEDAYWGEVDTDYRVARLAALEGAPAVGEDGNTHDFEEDRRRLRGLA